MSRTTTKLDIGSHVRTADAAAFPYITGKVLEVSHIRHFDNDQVVAVYYKIKWSGRGPKPDEWQISDGVVELTPDPHGNRVAPATLF